MAFPFRFKRCHIDDDAATCIGRFADADREDIARDAEIFNAASECKRIRWHDAHISFDIDERTIIKLFWIDDGIKNIREDFKFISHAQVIAVAREAVANERALLIRANLFFSERFDHAMV